ncbi:MAG: DUF5110 domain-containing protein [Verrucomicrobia bacterium]|nr:DUF5110 domain-containing protein [Verrucomicrobiota bacterium]MCH8512737.1 DUF5110 domain-containing protein [Kiritimatiellia bacterium]
MPKSAGPILNSSCTHSMECGWYRFSLLTERLVRIEYSPDRAFEDRPGFVALTRPAALPFRGHCEVAGGVVLESEALRIHCMDANAAPTSENLRIEFPGGVWTPDAVDDANLGGCHCSLDCVNDQLIPKGVHPATATLHDNGCHWSLWNYTWRSQGKNAGEILAENRYANMSLDRIISETDEAEWPEPLREIIHERRKYPPGLLSRAGYFLLDDSNSPLIDPATAWLAERTGGGEGRDWYFFAYGEDFKQALADYRALSGATPMLPRYALGLWYSRYPTFPQAGLLETVEAFAQQGLPLSVLVLDLEWHRFGWNGWDWDPAHIPDPEGLLRFLGERGVHTTLNLHPESLPAGDSRAPAFLEAAGIGAEASAPVQSERGEAIHKGCYFSDNQRHMRAFMEVLHDPVKRQGVDFWWMDGLVELRETPHLDPQAWTNHLYQRHAQRTYPRERPMVMARSAGFGTHRYPFHFTGDTFCQWPVLKSSVEYLLRAGHMGQSYVTHDIGGHIGYSGKNLPGMLYLRWLQFGALSPICRLHSAGESERRPWKYSDAVQAGARAALALRTSLVPYLYTLARESAEKGLPICRSNPLEAPYWAAGYEIWDRYFIGDRLYVAPILEDTESASAILPPGGWVCGLTGRRIESDGTTEVSLETDPTLAPPHFFKAGCVFVKQPSKQAVGELPTDLEVHCFFPIGQSNAGDVFELYEDDGLSTAHEAGAFATTAFTWTADETTVEIKISPRYHALPEQPRHRNYRIYLHGAPAAAYRYAGRAMDRQRSEGGAWVHTVDVPALDTDTEQVLSIMGVG